MTSLISTIVRHRRSLPALVMLAFVLAGCAGKRRVDNATGTTARERSEANAFDVMRVYQEAGLIAQSTPIPFVGAVQYLATDDADSTLVHLTLSLASRALTFAREGDAYQAGYQVTLELRRGGVVVDSSTSREVIRVSSFRETSRADESVTSLRLFSTVPPRLTSSVPCVPSNRAPAVLPVRQISSIPFAYRARKYIGSYLAAMGGADAIVFSGRCPRAPR